MLNKKNTKIAVIKGGTSSEREISLVTGAACAEALRTEGYQVIEIDVTEKLISDLKFHKPSIVFNALHGYCGEDGIIQGVLEWLGIKYTHSGVLASAMAMNKEKSKEIFQNIGLPIAESSYHNTETLDNFIPMNYPFVSKPIDEGSSVGVEIIRNEKDYKKLKMQCLTPGSRLMFEKFIPGKELTVTVMGDRALAVTDIVSTDWYDYNSKYKIGGSEHILPANLPNPISQACLAYGLKAHRALGCRGVTRTDFRWDESKGLQGIFILELNTQPGMTPTSLVPEQALYCGITFQELCVWIVEDSSCQR